MGTQIEKMDGCPQCGKEIVADEKDVFDFIMNGFGFVNNECPECGLEFRIIYKFSNFSPYRNTKKELNLSVYPTKVDRNYDCPRCRTEMVKSFSDTFTSSFFVTFRCPDHGGRYQERWDFIRIIVDEENDYKIIASSI